jgi:hypothetical protein
MTRHQAGRGARRSERLLPWKVHTPNLLQEILNNNTTAILRLPLAIFSKGLYAITERARQLNDKELNRLMLQLTLYEQADPTSKHYSKKIMKRFGL